MQLALSWPSPVSSQDEVIWEPQVLVCPREGLAVVTELSFTEVDC